MRGTVEVSGSDLARVCTELRVPRPERGYWALPFPRRAMVEALVETIRTDLAAGAPTVTPRAAR
jgi:hypothetical protein